MFIERFGISNSQREYRACGQFNAEEVRKFCNGGVDPRSLGCPEAILIGVMEKRAAANLEKRNANPNAPKALTDADRRRKAQEVALLIKQDEADAWLHNGHNN